jgi:hypothetical protein
MFDALSHSPMTNVEPSPSVRRCLSLPPPYRMSHRSQSPSRPSDPSHTLLRAAGPPLGDGASMATLAQCAPPSNPPSGRPSRQITRACLDWRTSTQSPSVYPITTSMTSHSTLGSRDHPLPHRSNFLFTNILRYLFFHNQSRLMALSINENDSDYGRSFRP